MPYFSVQCVYVCVCVTAAVVCVLSSGQRVFLECGWKLDAVDGQGLILSPGFPQNYPSGSHCVWRFLVPVTHQLTMEVLDFDVFEGLDRSWSSVRISSEDELLAAGLSRIRTATEPGGGSDEAQWNATHRVSEREHGSTTPPAGQDGSDTLRPLLKEACPGDVLYITDLSSFSWRFCGSRRPSDRLVFGSDAKAVEVIMELITNTHRGRGFALMFRYQNRTAAADGEGGQRSSAPPVGAVEVLLVAVSVTALFTTSVMIVLCVTRRPKLCVKESMTSSINAEVPVQNLHTDDSEPAKHHTAKELNKNNTLPLPHTADVDAASECCGFQNAALEFSTGLMEMELGADEVFVMSNPDTSFSSYMQRDRIPHRSETVSVPPSDWTPRSEPPNLQGCVASPRGRAWTVRTFQDFVLPFPELNRKWCSWNLTSPFTKLVDAVPPGSVVDTGDDVKEPSVQRPCEADGALCGPEQEVEVTICSFDTAADQLCIPVISEEDDGEPLVPSEDQKRVKHHEIRKSFPSISSAHSVCTHEHSSDLYIQPSHVITPCDSMRSDV